MKKLTKTKIKFIVENFFEKNDIDLKKFEKLKSPEELHFLADIYNWDYDFTVLRKIIQSQYCDKGTALMIFWRACPEDILEFSSEKEASIHGQAYKLIQEIIERYTKDKFKSKIISYDHRDDNHNEVINRKPKQIDNVFYDKTNGERFPIYVWPEEKEIKRTLVTQEEAGGLVKIKVDVHCIFVDEKENFEIVDKMICLNSREVEKDILFPIKLKQKKHKKTATNNTWTANCVLLTNEKCEVTSKFLTSSDNDLILDYSDHITNLKFKLTESIKNITMGEIYVEVSYSINNSTK